MMVGVSVTSKMELKINVELVMSTGDENWIIGKKEGLRWHQAEKWKR